MYRADPDGNVVELFGSDRCLEPNGTENRVAPHQATWSTISNPCQSVEKF